MGEKQARKRKYLFFYCTCFLTILLLGIGCAATLNFQKRQQSEKSFKKGEKFIIKGEYEEALIEYEKVLRLFPRVSPGDNALFHIGLIWLHPDNPQKNYEKSLISFQRVIHDFSQTGLRETAKVLSYTVTELIRSESDIKKFKESADSLQNRLRKENEEQTKTLKKQMEELKKLKERIGKLKGQTGELKEQLRELKEIDIVIEEKKRDRDRKRDRE
ncbi:MAG: hypothetical protein LWW98_09445 [Deltaproteobacteria bacterium]|nr:hypothetical protein [Deltaproteobacteria bacterium]